MLPALSAFAPLLTTIFKTVDKAIPDKDLAEKLKAEMNMQLLQSGTEELKASARIVEAEAKAGWFASSWRPLLMYVMIFILIINYIIAPMVKAVFHVSIGFDLPTDVFTLLQIGLGGYVVGRSGESIARTLASRPIQGKDQNG
jgi:hypothetical protein